MHTFPDFRCPAEAMGLVAILFSLLPMWIVMGNGKWLIRGAIGVAAIGLLVPLKAYQPIVFFSIAGVASIFSLSVTRFFAQRYQVCRRQPRAIPRIWRRLEFWFGAVGGLTAGLSAIGWAKRMLWDLGWLEVLLIFTLVFATVQIISMMFGDRFRLGRLLISKSESFGRSFKLFEVLLAFVLLAVFFAINAFAQQQAPVLAWRSVLVAAGFMTLMTVSTAGAFTAIRYHWRLTSLVVLGIVLGLSFQHGPSAWKWLMQASAFSFLPGSPWRAMIWLYTAALLMTTLCATTAGLFRFRKLDSLGDRATCRIGAIASLCIVGLFSACLIPIGIEMIPPLKRPDPIEEDATVYYELETAMARLVTLNPQENTLAELNEVGRVETASALLKSYASISQTARQLFRAPDPLSEEIDVYSLGQKLNVFRAWARYIDKEGKASVKSGQLTAASQRWIDCIHVGHGLGRGGDLPYTLTGIAIEGIGHEGMARIRNDLLVNRIRGILPTLISIDSQREHLDSIRMRSDLTMERQMNWQYRLSLCASSVLSAQSPTKTQTLVSPAMEATEDAICRRNAAIRLLIAELAIRLFEAKHNRAPSELVELVPEFLPSVPTDPFTGRPMIYRVKDTGFVVYCVGMDREDNGGVFGDITSLYDSGYDFDLDSLIRPPMRNNPTTGGGGIGGMGRGE